MKDMKSMEKREWYRAKSPETLARRLYGRRVIVKAEHSDAWHPAYRMWMVLNRYGTVYDRIYEPIYEFERRGEE